MSENIALPVSSRVRELAVRAQRDIEPYFARIDAVAEENTRKVLGAFQKHRVADGYFGVLSLTVSQEPFLRLRLWIKWALKFSMLSTSVSYTHLHF